MACQWEDEQTGGHCAEPRRALHRARRRSGSPSPTERTSTRSTRRRSTAGTTSSSSTSPTRRRRSTRRWSRRRCAAGLPDGDGPSTDRRGHAAARPGAAAADVRPGQGAFEQEPAVRVLFDNGAGTSPPASKTAGDPYAAYEHSFTTLPVPGTQARSWYLAPNGGARRLAAERAARRPLHLRRRRRRRTNDFTGNTGGGGLWGNASQWTWNWQQNKAGTARLLHLGPAHLERHDGRRGSRRAVGEVLDARRRPAGDGQRGARRPRDLRAERLDPGSERKLATTSDNIFKQQPTLLEPIPTMRASDAAPMPSNAFTKVTIPLYFQGHAYRAGSQIRVTHRRPQRHPADLGVRRDPAERSHRAGVPRLLLDDALATRAPGGPGLSIDSAAADLSQPAQRAVPVGAAVVGPGRRTNWLP